MARPAKPPLKNVAFDEQKLTKFAEARGIGKTNLYKYYMGSVPAFLNGDDYGAVLTELFRDAVDVGAVVIPSPYCAGDFTLTMPSGKIGWARGVQLNFKGVVVKVGEKEEFVQMSKGIGDLLSMDSERISNSLADIVRGIDPLVAP